MCTAAVSRASALSSRVAHPPTHRPSGHATRLCRWQARTGARRLDPTIRNLPLRRMLHRASRPPRTHVLCRTLTRARRHDRPLRPPSLRRHHRHRRHLFRRSLLLVGILYLHPHRPPTLPATSLSRTCRAHRQSLRQPPGLPSHQLLRSMAATIHLRIRVLHARSRTQTSPTPPVTTVHQPRRAAALHEPSLRRLPLLRLHRCPRGRRLLHADGLTPRRPSLPNYAPLRRR